MNRDIRNNICHKLKTLTKKICNYKSLLVNRTKGCRVQPEVKRGWHPLVHAIKVEATHPKLGNAMRVAVTHPCNNIQWNEGGSDTPYVVIKEAMQVSNLRWGGGPTQPAT